MAFNFRSKRQRPLEEIEIEIEACAAERGALEDKKRCLVQRRKALVKEKALAHKYWVWHRRMTNGGEGYSLVPGSRRHQASLLLRPLLEQLKQEGFTVGRKIKTVVRQRPDLFKDNYGTTVWRDEAHRLLGARYKYGMINATRVISDPHEPPDWLN